MLTLILAACSSKGVLNNNNMNMKSLIEQFPAQLKEAMAIGEKAVFTKPEKEIHNAVITGLGGSGIGGTIVTQVTAGQIKVPVVVNKDYFLPSFVSAHTLVIVSSYSGNTEETTAAMESALAKKSTICCVTSGGKVLETALKHRLSHVIIPSGYPPRAAFAYSFTQLLYIMEGYGLIESGFRPQLSKAMELLISESEDLRAASRVLAEKLKEKIPIIYSEANFEGVGIRFRQQVNENGKMLCWHHALPEMNHNELVGWTTRNENLAVVFLRNANDYERTRARMELSKKIIGKYTPHVFEVYSKGDSLLERVFYLVHFGDWVSWYLSEIRQIDATEVKVIDFLKGELGKV